MISLIPCEFSTKNTPFLCELIQNPKTFGFSIAKSKWIWYNNYGNTKGNRKTTPKRCFFFEEISVLGYVTISLYAFSFPLSITIVNIICKQNVKSEVI